MRRFLSLALFVVAFFASFRSSVEACRCAPFTLEENFAKAGVVFSGTVVAVQREGLEVHAFVEWLEVWKGELDARRLVRVVTGADSASCGYPFVEGDSLVIFTRTSPDVVRTDTCTLTGQVEVDELTEAYGPGTVNPLSVQLRRGDINADRRIDIADPIANLSFLFGGGFRPTCLETHDFDDDGTINLTDAVAQLTYLFGNGVPPAPPFENCGKPTGQDSVDLSRFDCVSYSPCPTQRERNEVVRVERTVDGEGNRVVEVEVFSTRPFIPRALIPTLCIGGVASTRSRPAEDGSPNRLVFTYPDEEFDESEEAPLVLLQHWEPCAGDLEDQSLYWDLWVFGRRRL